MLVHAALPCLHVSALAVCKVLAPYITVAISQIMIWEHAISGLSTKHGPHFANSPGLALLEMETL